MLRFMCMLPEAPNASLTVPFVFDYRPILKQEIAE